MNRGSSTCGQYQCPMSDANCLLSVMFHCLKSSQYVNVVVAGKHPALQWLTMEAAVNLEFAVDRRFEAVTT